MSSATGLTVRPSTKADKIRIEELFEIDGFYAEYNEEFNEFEMQEENVDSLERILDALFGKYSISASFSTY